MTPSTTKVARATCRRLAILAAIVPAFLAAPAGAQLNEALQAQAQTDKEAGQSQNRVNDIREKTQDAAGRYAQAMADADSLERYNKQLDEQVKSQETEMASIERQLLDIETTNREVQPLMEQMVETLEQFVKLDVPFLLDERTARVAGLQALMARADVTISEKYRRILEAYQIELDYGRSLDAYEGRLGTGADAPGSAESRSCIARSTARRRAIGTRARRTGSSTRATAKRSKKLCALRRKTGPPIC
jgi:hypothetical protein